MDSVCAYLDVKRIQTQSLNFITRQSRDRGNTLFKARYADVGFGYAARRRCDFERAFGATGHGLDHPPMPKYRAQKIDYRDADNEKTEGKMHVH